MGAGPDAGRVAGGSIGGNVCSVVVVGADVAGGGGVVIAWVEVVDAATVGSGIVPVGRAPSLAVGPPGDGGGSETATGGEDAPDEVLHAAATRPRQVITHATLGLAITAHATHRPQHDGGTPRWAVRSHRCRYAPPAGSGRQEEDRRVHDEPTTEPTVESLLGRSDELADRLATSTDEVDLDGDGRVDAITEVETVGYDTTGDHRIDTVFESRTSVVDVDADGVADVTSRTETVLVDLDGDGTPDLARMVRVVAIDTDGDGDPDSYIAEEREGIIENGRFLSTEEASGET